MHSLFALIKSLTPSEKRYFKLFAQRQVQSKNTNYAKLFDAINEQESYNEDALLKKFKHEKFAKQFAVAKNYLYDMILGCLQDYNEENYIEWKIRNLFLQIKVLASKGLDEEAHKLIKKTKELAWQYELYYVIADIMIVEKYLFGNFRIGEPTIEEYMAMDKEEAHAFEIAMNWQQVGNVWHYLTLLELEIGILPQHMIKQRADIYVNAYCMKQEPPVSYNSKFRYYSTWSLYYNLINDQQKNYDCCKKAILIREEQIEKQPLLNMDPLAAYYNFMQSCEKAYRWDEFEYYLKKTHEFKAPTIEVNIRRMHNYCRCGLMYYLHQKQYNKAYEIVKEYKFFFVDGKINFRKDFKLYIEICCGLVCFFMGKNKEAMHWWNNYLNKPLPQIELATQGALRIYILMLHIQENTTDILDYLLKQSKKYLEQISLLHEPEKIFLKQVQLLSTESNKKKQQHVLKETLSQLQNQPLQISGNAVNPFVLDWLNG